MIASMIVRFSRFTFRCGSRWAVTLDERTHERVRRCRELIARIGVVVLILCKSAADPADIISREHLMNLCTLLLMIAHPRKVLYGLVLDFGHGLGNEVFKFSVAVTTYLKESLIVMAFLVHEATTMRLSFK